jgi:hypothetical protein
MDSFSFEAFIILICKRVAISNKHLQSESIADLWLLYSYESTALAIDPMRQIQESKCIRTLLMLSIFFIWVLIQGYRRYYYKTVTGLYSNCMNLERIRIMYCVLFVLSLSWSDTEVWVIRNLIVVVWNFVTWLVFVGTIFYVCQGGIYNLDTVCIGVKLVFKLCHVSI